MSMLHKPVPGSQVFQVSDLFSLYIHFCWIGPTMVFFKLYYFLHNLTIHYRPTFEEK